MISILNRKSLLFTTATRRLTPFAKRYIYFIKPERTTEMVDFALNLGYNDLYSGYCGQYLNWKSKIKLGLR